jgi:hypothetical protein
VQVEQEVAGGRTGAPGDEAARTHCLGKDDGGAGGVLPVHPGAASGFACAVAVAAGTDGGAEVDRGEVAADPAGQ